MHRPLKYQLSPSAISPLMILTLRSISPVRDPKGCAVDAAASGCREEKPGRPAKGGGDGQ
jgi:hypothetical protein